MAGLLVSFTHLEPDVLSFFKDHEVRSIDQLVVAMSPNPKVHLIAKLKWLWRPVEVDQLYLPRWSNETYGTMISRSASLQQERRNTGINRQTREDKILLMNTKQVWSQSISRVLKLYIILCK